jgi:hypothetical protein
MGKFKPREKFNHKDAAYRVALAGISAALATLFVGLSVLVRFSTIAFYVAGGIALVIPVCKRFYSSAVFAYIVSAVLGLVFTGFDFVSVSGYILYFAPMAIMSAIMQEKNLKWYFALIPKTAFIAGMLAALFYGLGTIVIDASLLADVPFWLVIVVGMPALLALDFLMQRVYRVLKPIVGKVLRNRNGAGIVQKENEEAYDDASNPFDEFNDGEYDGEHIENKADNGGESPADKAKGGEGSSGESNSDGGEVK